MPCASGETAWLGALIDNGDIVLMRPIQDQKAVKNGAIVAARVNDDGYYVEVLPPQGQSG